MSCLAAIPVMCVTAVPPSCSSLLRLSSPLRHAGLTCALGWIWVCWLNTVPVMLTVNEQTLDLVSKSNSSEMNIGKCVNNSQPLCSSLHISCYVHVTPATSGNFNREYWRQPCSVLFYQAIVLCILQTKNGGFKGAAENPSLLVRAQCAGHCARANSLAGGASSQTKGVKWVRQWEVLW